jgi:hypothetical protein
LYFCCSKTGEKRQKKGKKEITALHQVNRQVLLVPVPGLPQLLCAKKATLMVSC